MTIQKILDHLKSYHPNLGPDYDGCDGIKVGDPNVECRGVVSALVPTMEVLEKTAALGVNLLFVHEPTSYLTPDWPDWKAGFSCSVYDKKIQFAIEHGIVIVRDHDHMHAHRPDSIFTGVLKYMGWLPYLAKDQTVPYGYVVDLPEEMTLNRINTELIERIGLNGLRFLGKPDLKIKRLAIAGHIYPDAFIEQHFTEDGDFTDYATELIRAMEESGVQCILPGEIIEWTLVSYIRDAITQGKDLALIHVGHFNWEELGARYAADWLKTLVDEDVPVTYVPTGDLWQFQLKK